LAIGAVLLLASLAPAFALDAKAVYEETVDQTFPLGTDGSFTLTNRNGGIELSAWDKNEVRIVAEKRMRLDGGGWWLARFIGLKQTTIESDADAQELFKKLSIEFTGDEKSRTVTTHYPESRDVNCQVSYRISAPRGAKVSLETVNGGIQVDGVGGGAQLETTSGSVSVENVRGPIRVETTNGRVTLERVTGEITAEATNGSVTARLIPDAKLENVELRSVNGSIRLYVPAAAGFHLNARTVNGSVNCDLPLSSVTQQSRKRIEGIVGTPGGRVELSTTNGSVQIGSAG
jgi:DUF4097 and DUF4098 domain-containing protein YvlB